ncbi:hypothetical protein Sru01_56340 [Sphaerisporangium rufum]|uniref:AB hydrolase-1 domain-containing protein n=1 Tax=Sphaerisporangium rufum TaxID=1381558 RepID=A0A919V3C2_9ACTN|nr:alpha/beta hydrolase [Sphaerisporangium rufum]GII80652.1 hypothetical protein Sru01_56340 [Sphaerisporangium rufum]
MRVVFVHGACVRDGAWWWSRVAALLGERGVASEAVALPSCGEDGRAPGTGGPGLADDVAAVRRVLAGGGPVTAVGHSYGGVVITEAAAGVPEVTGLLYIAAFLPEPGESLATFGGGEVPPYLDPAADGTFGVRREMLQDLFLQDCDEAAVTGAEARLARQSLHATTEPVQAAAWRQVPATYLVCADDRATPPAVQRAQAARAGRVVEVPAGHHPFLSRPELVARELPVG